MAALAYELVCCLNHQAVIIKPCKAAYSAILMCCCVNNMSFMFLLCCCAAVSIVVVPYLSLTLKHWGCAPSNLPFVISAGIACSGLIVCVAILVRSSVQDK